MPLSTWDSAEQHSPPQLLLRSFKKKGSSSHIWCHDRQTGRLSSERISKVARQPHLMTVEDDLALRRIEQRANDALVKLHERCFDKFKESDRKAVDQFVVALMFNHASWVAVKERIRREVIDDKVASSAFNAGLVGRSLDVPAAYGLLDALTSRNYLRELVNNGRSQLLLGLRSMRLTVHGPPYGQSFVIGDYPVVDLPSGRLGLFHLPFSHRQVFCRLATILSLPTPLLPFLISWMSVTV